MLTDNQLRRLKAKALNWVFIRHDTVEVIEQDLTIIVKVKTGNYEGGVFAAIKASKYDSRKEPYYTFIDITDGSKQHRFYLVKDLD